MSGVCNELRSNMYAHAKAASGVACRDAEGGAGAATYKEDALLQRGAVDCALLQAVPLQLSPAVFRVCRVGAEFGSDGLRS